MALHLPINDECNIRCAFCSAEGRDGRFDLPHVQKQIDRDRSGHVQISGGEPMLRKPAELLQILLHCRKRGKYIEFQTNGTLIARCDPKRLKMIIGLTDLFNVNFSAHTPKLEAAVTGVPGAFARRIAGVRRLLALGAAVRLNYVVCEANYRHGINFVRFAHEKLSGFSWIQFSYCKGMGRARGNAKVMPRFQKVAPHLNDAFRLCSELGIGFDIDHIPVCFTTDYKEHHADYRKMRNGEPGAHVMEKRHMAACVACTIKKSCPGPRRDYIAFYGNL